MPFADRTGSGEPDGCGVDQAYREDGEGYSVTPVLRFEVTGSGRIASDQPSSPADQRRQRLPEAQR